MLEVPRTIDEWIARDAMAFSLEEARRFDAAVDALIASLGDGLDVLGLGEMMHGSEGILALRNVMFQRLVAKHGYTAIALESSFPRGRIADGFVAGHAPMTALDEACEFGFSHGFGKFDATRELLLWMREHNATAPTPLRIDGFDSPTEMGPSDSPRQLLDVAFAGLASVDAPRAETYRDRMRLLLGDDAAWENPAAAFDPSKGIGRSPAADELRVLIEDLIADIDLRRPEFPIDRHAEIARHAAHARQMLTYHATIATPSDDRLVRLLGLRDAMMADNLVYLAERERRRGGKLFAFAHNSHLKRGKAKWQMGPSALEWWPAGAHVAAMLGSRYAVIGAALGTSEANGIGAPESGTIEDRLTASPGPMRFVPTRGARSLAMPPARSSGENPGYFPLTADFAIDYDAIVAFDSSTYTRGGPMGGAR